MENLCYIMRHLLGCHYGFQRKEVTFLSCWNIRLESQRHKKPSCKTHHSRRLDCGNVSYPHLNLETSPHRTGWTDGWWWLRKCYTRAERSHCFVWKAHTDTSDEDTDDVRLYTCYGYSRVMTFALDADDEDDDDGKTDTRAQAFCAL